MNEGFSLIELMVVVAIISLLCLLAYPSYQQFIIRAHRNDGQIALLDLSSRMEWHFSKHHSYETATIEENETTDVLSVRQSRGGWYTLAITQATPSSYTLLATPMGAQAKGDRQCQSLTHDSQGSKGITKGPMGMPLGPAEACW